jgi:hypothetical protein
VGGRQREFAARCLDLGEVKVGDDEVGQVRDRAWVHRRAARRLVGLLGPQHAARAQRDSETAAVDVRGGGSAVICHDGVAQVIQNLRTALRSIANRRD